MDLNSWPSCTQVFQQIALVISEPWRRNSKFCTLPVRVAAGPVIRLVPSLFRRFRSDFIVAPVKKSWGATARAGSFGARCWGQAL